MTTEQSPSQPEKAIWRKALKELTDSELRTIVFDLGEINFDNLSGRNLNERVMSLLDLLERDSRLTELKEYIFSESELAYLKNSYLAEKLDLKRRDIEGVDTAESPYRGLQAFHEEHANIYFGRAPLADQLTQKFRFTLAQPDQPNLLAIIGASGSGKSSLARAGMIPKLRQQGWPIYIMTPTADPLESMSRVLMAGVESKTAALTMQDDLRQDHRSLRAYLPDIAARHTDDPQQIVLVIDQFEELFTLCRDDTKRDQFVENLLDTLDPQRPSKLAILLTLRADFYHRVAWSDGLREILQNQQKYIGRMSRADLQQTIEGPAHLYGYHLQEGLVKRILDDVGNEPGNLPLLSHALQETWQQREGADGKQLTLVGYEKAGGVKGAIARTADAALASLSDPQQAIVRNIFTRLTELGEGSEDTRRRARLSELIPNDTDSETVLTVLAKLAGARLVTTGSENVEVSHEALIREWQTLRHWLDSDRDGLRLLEQLNSAATFWDEHERHNRDLYSGTRLDKALEWEAESAPQLSQLETQFLRTSQEATEKQIQEEQARVEREIAQAKALAEAEVAAREQAQMRADEAEKSSKQLRQRRNLAFGAAGIAMALAIIALIFFGQATTSANTAATSEARAVANEALAVTEAANAVEAQNTANQNAERAATSEWLAEQNAADALTEAANAVAAQQTAEASQATANRQRTISDAQSMLALSSALIPKDLSPSITETAKSLLMGAQSQRINQQLDAAMDQNFSDTQLRDMLDRNYRPPWQAILDGHTDFVLSVAFAPDGNTLASASYQEIRLWDMTNPSAPPTILDGHTDFVLSVAFAPDGNTLASASSDQTIRLWDMTNPSAPPTILDGHTDLVLSVAFAPDGNTLASASSDQTIRLWDMTNPSAPPTILDGHTDWVNSVAFAPDGNTLASASSDQTIRLWDMTNPSAPPTILDGHTGEIWSVAFAPDGNTLASASYQEIRLWDMTNPSAPPTILDGHTSFVRSVAFAPDGNTLASASYQEIRLWDMTNPSAPPTILDGHTSEVRSVTFAPDGNTLASASSDQTIRLWDMTNPSAPPTILDGHTGEIWSVAFAPDGNTLASASYQEIRLWDMTNPSAPPTILDGHTSFVRSVAFAPDGNTLASASSDQTIRLWDMTNPSAPPTILDGHTDWVNSVAFAPDGNTLASASSDQTIRLWDMTNPSAPPTILDGHTGPIWSVAFAPDGNTLASASSDQTIRLWDMTNPSAPPTILDGHTSEVLSVAFAPDGNTLASASGGFTGADYTIRLWDMTNPSAPPTILDGHTEAVRSVAFAPDGNTLASASYQEIRLWDMTNPSAPPTILDGHTDLVLSVAFAPDGNTLASASRDQTIRLWPTLSGLVEIACERAGRNMTWDEWNQYLSGRPYQLTCPQYPPHPTVPKDEQP